MLRSHPAYTSERRGHPRILNKLPLKLNVNSRTAVTETINISASGAYCEIDMHIAPMTKLGLILFIPIRLNSGRTVTKNISCKGVVVRAEKSKSAQDRYNIAIFFTRMKAVDLKHINNYIESHNPALKNFL
jgi:hypothetical protein